MGEGSPELFSKKRRKRAKRKKNMANALRSRLRLGRRKRKTDPKLAHFSLDEESESFWGSDLNMACLCVALEQARNRFFIYFFSREGSLPGRRLFGKVGRDREREKERDGKKRNKNGVHGVGAESHRSPESARVERRRRTLL